MPVFVSSYKTPDDDTPAVTATQPAGCTVDGSMAGLLVSLLARGAPVMVTRPQPGVYFLYCRDGKFSVSGL